ncbi:hypothetical protein BKA81DRAFT_371686 [Phyllosticta paracitricarpa]
MPRRPSRSRSPASSPSPGPGSSDKPQRDSAAPQPLQDEADVEHSRHALPSLPDFQEESYLFHEMASPASVSDSNSDDDATDIKQDLNRKSTRRQTTFGRLLPFPIKESPGFFEASSRQTKPRRRRSCSVEDAPSLVPEAGSPPPGPPHSPISSIAAPISGRRQSRPGTFLSTEADDVVHVDNQDTPKSDEAKKDAPDFDKVEVKADSLNVNKAEKDVLNLNKNKGGKDRLDVKQDALDLDDDESGSDDANDIAKGLQELADGAWLSHRAIFLLGRVFELPGVQLLETGEPPGGDWDAWTQHHHYQCAQGAEHVFFILHLRARMHWVVFHLDVCQETVVFYDSLQVSNDNGGQMERAAVAMTRACGFNWSDGDWSFVPKSNIPQQQGGSDCGVFALVFYLHAAASSALPDSIDPATWRSFFRNVLRSLAGDDAVRNSAADPQQARAQARESKSVLRHVATALYSRKRLADDASAIHNVKRLYLNEFLTQELCEAKVRIAQEHVVCRRAVLKAFSKASVLKELGNDEEKRNWLQNDVTKATRDLRRLKRQIRNAKAIRVAADATNADIQLQLQKASARVEVVNHELRAAVKLARDTGLTID